ncbi:MAG TPA: histidinol-phosphate transaminase [Kiritimatiellia bacterium]|nr:histidinol-phosphate transaminase [Kiritimatiellia bacterium]
MTRICPHVQELHAYIPGEQPRTPGLIKLNTNENPYPPSPRVLEALMSAESDALRMYPDPMCNELKSIIAELHQCKPENVFAGNGSDEGLALCTRAFVEHDGTIGSFEPSYSLYPVLAAIRPARMELIELNEDFTWRDPGKLKSSLFYLANPNAPTSMSFPYEAIEALCRTYHGVLLIDEAYADFAPWNCMELALKYPNTLVSRTLSKSYSLAGIRCGYLVGPVDLIAAIHKIKDSYNINHLTQRLASAALRDQSHMRRNVENIISTRNRIAVELQNRGYHVAPSATNFLWVKPSGVTASELFTQLRKRNILTRYFPGAKTGEYLRVTIGTDEQMNAFVAALP